MGGREGGESVWPAAVAAGLGGLGAALSAFATACNDEKDEVPGAGGAEVGVGVGF